MVENPRGSGRIQEIWTLYPDESPTTVIADIQPVLIEEGRNAILLEASHKLDLSEDPAALRILEAARSSALMVSSFTMDGTLLSQNPASHACYAQTTDASRLAGRFTDEAVGATILSAVRQAGQYETEVDVATARGQRIHRIMA